MNYKISIIACAFAVGAASPTLADIDTYLDGFCDANTFDVQQCACTKATFADEIAKRRLSSDQAEMASLFLGQSGLDMMVFTQAMQGMDRNLMTSVIPVVGQLQGPIYQTCVETSADTFNVEETATIERYLQACIFTSGQSSEAKETCKCQADAFAGQFDDDRFMLITELTEVEAGGLAGDMDPLEYLLKDKRGLSADAANELLMENRDALMSVPPIILSCAQKVTGMDDNLGTLLESMMPMAEN